MGRSPAELAAGLSPAFGAILTAEPLGGVRALDVGTGRGRVALLLAAHGATVIGLDHDPRLIDEARARAAAAGLGNATFAVVDVEAVEYAVWRPDFIVAHLCVSDAIIERAGRALAPGRRFALVAFHADQWKETGRRSRFAYDEEQARRALVGAGFTVTRLEVERDVQRFESVEHALAAAVSLEEKWKADGRWFRYIRFLELGGRTLTRAHLIAEARRT